MDKYSVIYAHPQWKYNKHYPIGEILDTVEDRRNYRFPGLMSLQEIMAIPVEKIAERDCVLFLWATTPMLPEALTVVDTWGFVYKTLLTWEKTNDGCMGYWFKTCTEHLIVAVKGNVKAFGSSIRNCYHEPQIKRGIKPDYFYRLIEKVTTGRKIELFARRKRNGWDSYNISPQSEMTFELTY